MRFYGWCTWKTGKTLPATNRDMDGSNGAKQADSWHKHEPFMMVEKQKNKSECNAYKIELCPLLVICDSF